MLPVASGACLLTGKLFCFGGGVCSVVVELGPGMYRLTASSAAALNIISMFLGPNPFPNLVKATHIPFLQTPKSSPVFA